MYKQITTLRNYYATSDPDTFCFDKHKDPEEHYEAWIKEYFEVNPKDISKMEGNDECRVYPKDLLPQEHQHQKGHWRIVVEFIPSGTED